MSAVIDLRHLVVVLLIGGALVRASWGMTLDEAEKIAPLPSIAHQGGVVWADLNEDGHQDLIVSNKEGYGVFLFNPLEKKHLQWSRGWSQVLREGKPGDAHSLPLLKDARFEDGWLIFANGTQRLSRAHLLRVPGPPLLSPEESLKKLHVQPGWAVSLAATEPLVQDPVFIDWDERGRAWVVEMGDYPFAPGEKTQDGKVGQERISELQTGRVKILSDTDGDGDYDRASLFLSGLRHPTGLACARGGVFISAIPDVIHAADTDGDERCDRIEPWFQGFTAGNPQHLVNGFCWGLDGWLYGANGDSGGEVTAVRTGQKLRLGTNDFRFHPESGCIELEAGRTQYGRWRDDFGNWFGNNNSTLAWHYFLPMRWLEAHPDRVASALRRVTNEDKSLYPVSPEMRRFNWASAKHTLTSGCSPMPWFDGKESSLLICEPANNLVHRQLLDLTQLPITSRRHPQEATSELIASEDNHFRPSQIRQGPDGAFYLVDMYRQVLEHPEWIPAEIARGLDLRAGEDRGRLYRLTWPGMKPAPHAMGSDLLAEMRSSIRWRRDTAQRLLLEQKDTAKLPRLLALGQDSQQPLPVRLQAIWTAALLDAQHRSTLHQLIRASFPQVRGAAMVAAGGDEIHPEELATWFPRRAEAQPAALLPVLGKASTDRQKIVRRYLTQLPALRGDKERGRQVFARTCMACHRLQDVGVEVGPDLATVASKPVEQLLEALFDPNRAVELRNATTQITRHNGTALAGLLVAETPTSITLRMPGGLDLPIPRSEIRSTHTLATSLMPEGLEAALTPQDVADLLAHLRP